jgi:hypothetical protein
MANIDNGQYSPTEPTTLFLNLHHRRCGVQEFLHNSSMSKIDMT